MQTFHQPVGRSILAVGFCCLLLSACTQNTNTSDSTSTDTTMTTTNGMDSTGAQKMIKPTAPKPAWGQNMTDEMAAVIEKLMSYKVPPLPTLTAQEARTQKSFADAYKDVAADNNIVLTSNTDTTGKDISVAGGNIHLRIYTPKTGRSSYPVIVYYRGGGWIITNLDTYGPSADAMATMADAIVVSVDYRQGPEFKYPTAHNDCFAAYEWVLKNAASIKGNPAKIAVMGESAGGNLATAVSMMARDKKIKMPLHQVLVYPIAGYDFSTASYMQNDSTAPLNAAGMKWFFSNYLNSPADGSKPWISLVTANVKGLPGTTIISAEYDPLATEGKTLADKLIAAGVTTNYKLFNGTTHEFFGMADVIPQAKDAQMMAANDLKNAFSK